MSETRTFKPLSGLWPWFAGALIAYSVTSFALALSNGIGSFQLQAVLDGDGSQAGIFDLHQGITGVLYLLALVFCIIQYCRFFYRAVSNLHAANVPNVSARPAGVIWWNIVPVASLWKPFQGIAQAWRGTVNGDAELGDIPVAMRW